MKICKCGCGNLVKTKTAIFLQGHNGRGRKRPEYEKKKISETMKRIMTDEMRKNRAKIWKGRKHTEKSKRKMSLAGKERERIKKEQGYTVSQEARKKISLSQKGKTLSKEHKRKIGKANKGKIISDEQRKKISKSKKEYFKSNVNPFKGKSHYKE